jgi:hypothetical protein
MLKNLLHIAAYTQSADQTTEQPMSKTRKLLSDENDPSISPDMDDPTGIPVTIPVIKKSALLMKTANDFDQMIETFENTELLISETLKRVGFSDDTIEQHVNVIRACKEEVEKLLPLRDNVIEIQDKILTPVEKVIETSIETNNRFNKTSMRFGWVGITVGAISLFFSLVAPRFWPRVFDPTRDLATKIDNLTIAMKPTIQNAETAKAKILLYDTFNSVEMLYDKDVDLKSVGSVGGLGYGQNSIGFHPNLSNVLVYKPVSVDCEKGCRLAVEAMIKLDRNIDIRQRQIDDHTYQPLLPVKVEYQATNDDKWIELDPIMKYLKVPLNEKRNEWQSINSPPVDIPAESGFKAVRLSLRNYKLMRTDGKQKDLVYPTSFDEIKLIVFRH